MLARHPLVFLKLAGLWSALQTAIPVAYCVAGDIGAGRPIDIGAGMAALGTFDNLRTYMLLTCLPAILGWLAISVGWMRFVLLWEEPRSWLPLPDGSARYFSRSLLLDLMFVVALIPVAVAARYAFTALHEPWGLYAAVAVSSAGALIAFCVYVRAWLVFPAIAARATMRFSESVRLTRGSTGYMILGALLAFAATVLLALSAFLAEAGEALGVPAGISEVAGDLIGSVMTSVGTALIAGFMAVAYRALVQDRTNEKSDPRGPLHFF